MANVPLHQAARDKLAKSQFGDPANRKFPVRKGALGQQDLEDATRLVGKAANPDQVRANLLKIAKRQHLKPPTSLATTESDSDEHDDPAKSGEYGAVKPVSKGQKLKKSVSSKNA